MGDDKGIVFPPYPALSFHDLCRLAVIADDAHLSFRGCFFFCICGRIPTLTYLSTMLIFSLSFCFNTLTLPSPCDVEEKESL